MPIDKISDIRRLPRLGKVRLGVKKEGQRGPYPSATDYFVVPEEVRAVHGDTPKELPVMFPSDDLELVAPQWYKCYSYSQGLVCKGDGKHCRRKVDIKTGDFADKDTKHWEIHDGVCDPDGCPKLASKQCRKMMSLLFILPEIPGLGVYQLNTSSFYSIVNLNSQLAPDGFLRHFTNGRIAFIPLILSLGPQEVNPPGEGRKTVQVLSVRADVKLADIIRISRQKPAQILLPTVEEEEPPEDLYPEEVLAQGEKREPTAANGETATGVTRPGEGETPTEGEEKIGGATKETGGTVDEASAANLSPPKGGEPVKVVTSPPALEQEGFGIDLTWLKESLEDLKWTDNTCKTFLVSKFKVSPTGILEDLISRLTREQAEEFIKEIQAKVAQKQMKLWQ